MLEFSAEELAALKKEHAADATNEQFTLWIEDCKRRGLVPVRDVIMQIRTAKEWDPELRAKVPKKKVIYITTIGAFRKVAERTGKYAGQLPTKWIYLDSAGQPTIESEIPLPDPTNRQLPLEPWAVRNTILRKGFDAPLSVVSRFSAYAQTYTRDNEMQLTSMWSNRGPEQIEKCGESACLRRGFPDELGGLFISEELEKEDVAAPPAPVEAVVAAPKAPTVPKVNHTPAVASDTPRPNAEDRQTLREVAPTLVELLVKPSIQKQLADKGLQVDAEAVGAVVAEAVRSETVQKMDEKPAEKPKRQTAKEKADAALDAEHALMMSAIDAERAKDADPDNRLPNDDEKKLNSARIRALIALGLSASEKNALQKFVEAGRPLTEKLQSDWKKVLTQLEAAGTKEAVLQLIAPQPVEEEF